MATANEKPAVGIKFSHPYYTRVSVNIHIYIYIYILLPKVYNTHVQSSVWSLHLYLSPRRFLEILSHRNSNYTLYNVFSCGPQAQAHGLIGGCRALGLGPARPWDLWAPSWQPPLRLWDWAEPGVHHQIHVYYERVIWFTMRRHCLESATDSINIILLISFP